MAANNITCPFCGAVSYNPNDIKFQYCGNCHRFHQQRDRKREGSDIRLSHDIHARQADTAAMIEGFVVIRVPKK
jgi:ribosomal protein S27AE